MKNIRIFPLGVTEDSEYVTVVKESYHVVRQKRNKYRCNGCHSKIVTTPAPKNKLVEGGQYSTEFAVNVANDKYAHHMPINRQLVKMKNQGLNLEHNTLIEQTHHLAGVFLPVYEKLKGSVQNLKVLGADETPWRMLEGDEKKSWYVWGFFGKRAAYYEARDTRSKEVANDILKDCKAQYLMVDGYTGYNKPSLDAGIKVAHCWAHTRRKFLPALEKYPECDEIVDLIAELYEFEEGTDDEHRLEKRETESKKVIDKIRDWIYVQRFLPKSVPGQAVNYVKKHWAGLTMFLEDPEIPLDNNLSERSLRDPVLGRKNFYGNHSKRGAETTSILYSIVESCKLNGIDSYKYMLATAKALLNGENWTTPEEFAQSSEPNVT